MCAPAFPNVCIDAHARGGPSAERSQSLRGELTQKFQLTYDVPAQWTTQVHMKAGSTEAVFLGQRVVVLASDPGRVAADLVVDLPADRPLEVKREPGFLRQRAEIEDLVRAYHRYHQSVRG